MTEKYIRALRNIVGLLESNFDVEEQFYSKETPVWAKDCFNNNISHTCGYCGAWMSVVRPGKVQCDFCGDGTYAPAIAYGALREVT